MMLRKWIVDHSEQPIKSDKRVLLINILGIAVFLMCCFPFLSFSQKSHIETLIQELQQNNQKTRNTAAVKLVNIGEPAIAPLIETLIHEGHETQQTVAWILGKIGTPAVNPLLDILKQTSFGTQGRLASNRVRDSIKLYAFKALIMIGSPSVEGLIALLTHDDMQVRLLAVNALRQIGDDRAITPLFKTLNDKQALICIEASTALKELGISTVEPVIPVLKHKESLIRTWAAEELGKIGDTRAIEPLSLALNDNDKSVRRSVVKALSQLGKPAVKALMNALANDDQFVRSSAATALGDIGDIQAIEPLIASLNDKSRMVSMRAREALKKIGSPAIQALTVALQNENPKVRKLVTETLERIQATEKN